jgi:hypothetical protein
MMTVMRTRYEWLMNVDRMKRCAKDALTSGGDWLLLAIALGMEGGCGVNMRVLF